MKSKKIKKTIDFHLHDIDQMEELKRCYKEKTKKTKVSNSFVLGTLLDTFAVLSEETREIIARSCFLEKKRIEISRSYIEDYGVYNDMHAKKDRNIINELEQVIDYMTFGLGYKQTVESKKKRKKGNFKEVLTATGYAKVPENWIEINPFDRQTTNSVYVVEMRNGDALGLPHFVFASDGKPDADAEEQIYKSISEVYPEFQEAVLDKQVDLEYDDEGNWLNLDEWSKSPALGIFLIETASELKNDDAYPFDAKYYPI